ncbi:crotonase/enoyl-CoA hydratase family protein [Enhygromyxa salina]|uniref:Putative enoyl-CoA hydratase n=1 Tax=Enhygromyxa salina TaxID=215803 RepID=A0A2S9XLC1_9BACT|nr:crotonase/enoyl-CoA hydratase family protein [Enhygromyxa salina]PRP93642.1 putative enoyl-CoA hydratase [Enhygromyxa salina]
MPTSDRVVCTIEAGVAEVRLNRGDKHNGLDPAMFEAIVAAGETLRGDHSVRVVILCGDGPSFCAGLDFKAFISGGEAVREQLLAWKDGQIGNLAQRLAWVWTTVPVPVIAAVHGTCVGGGLQLALAADLRVIHPDSKLAVREIEYGMIPDMSISKTLSRLVRLDVAKELTFTGRDFSGQEAAQLGIATRLSQDPLATAREIAAQIATRSPEAVRAAKQLWDRAPALEDEAALRLETQLQLPLLGSRNQLEAVQARFMKREPKFVDPA